MKKQLEEILTVHLPQGQDELIDEILDDVMDVVETHVKEALDSLFETEQS